MGSGGIYQEAFGLRKTLLVNVKSDTTERPEALRAGTVRLVGINYDMTMNEVSVLLDNQEYYNLMSKVVNPYRGGLACRKIINAI